MAFKTKLRHLIPHSFLNFYHWFVSYIVAWCYGFPARKLVVVGVTGTKGKTTVSTMIWHILEKSGYQAGLVSTAQFAVGNKVWLNDLKMTMPSRFNLQRLFKKMVKAGCRYVVLETSSEGLAQWRHAGIPYRVAVFTNLAPEHLEAHGSYESYRGAKGMLFKSLHVTEIVPEIKTASVVNLDDKEADYFLNFPAQIKIGFTCGSGSAQATNLLQARVKNVSAERSEFIVNDSAVNLLVGGQFNIENSLAALGAAQALNISLSQAIKALESFSGAPGRLEFVPTSRNFKVVVDYAHTPESLAAVYQALQKSGSLIAVLGSCGGGRDRVKREPLGKLAGTYADKVIVTNEDPYDENPREIMEAVARGARTAGKQDNQSLWVIEDRRQAIAQALSFAQDSNIVIITGKGAEQWLCVADGKKIPWDDRQVVRDELKRLPD